jgi:hypothetical protein
VVRTTKILISKDKIMKFVLKRGTGGKNLNYKISQKSENIFFINESSLLSMPAVVVIAIKKLIPQNIIC